MKSETDKLENPSRRSFIEKLSLSAVALASGCTTETKAGPIFSDAKNLNGEMTFDEARKLSPLVRSYVRTAQAEVMQEIANGKNIEELSDDQKAILRGNIQSLFRKDTDPFVISTAVRFAQSRSFTIKDSFVAISDEGVITAYRRVDDEWERAGWSAPKDNNIKEEQAFNKGKQPPSGEVYDRIFPNRMFPKQTVSIRRS